MIVSQTFGKNVCVKLSLNVSRFFTKAPGSGEENKIDKETRLKKKARVLLLNKACTDNIHMVNHINTLILHRIFIQSRFLRCVGGVTVKS